MSGTTASQAPVSLQEMIRQIEVCAREIPILRGLGTCDDQQRRYKALLALLQSIAAPDEAMVERLSAVVWDTGSGMALLGMPFAELPAEQRAATMAEMRAVLSALSGECCANPVPDRVGCDTCGGTGGTTGLTDAE